MSIFKMIMVRLERSTIKKEHSCKFYIKLHHDKLFNKLLNVNHNEIDLQAILNSFITKP